jgi:lipopolysaccharide export system protein LptA
VCASFLTLFVCLIALTLGAEETDTEGPPSPTNTAEIQTTEDAVEQDSTAEDTEATPVETKEIITGTSKRMESYEQEGITILIDEAKTVRRDEQGIEIGFLNADKITLKRDLETGATKEIVAEGNVEIRDQDIFATCDHAIMDNLTSTIILQENVVVLQDKDRLETKYFTFNRLTGKQTAEGDVKFKVTVTQATPVEPEADENTESGTDTDEENTSTTTSEKTEDPSQEETDADTDTAEGDTEEKSDTDAEDAEDTNTEKGTDTDAGSSEGTDPKEETDTDPGNPDDTNPDAETEDP